MRIAVVSGTAEANATIGVYDGATLLGTTAANGAGVWSFTPATALGAGLHAFTATLDPTNVLRASGDEAETFLSFGVLLPT